MNQPNIVCKMIIYINRFKDTLIEGNTIEFNKNLLDIYEHLKLIVNDKSNQLLKPIYLISLAYLLILFQGTIDKENDQFISKIDYCNSLKSYFTKRYPKHINLIDDKFIESLIRFKKMVNIRSALEEMNINKDIYEKIIKLLHI